MSEILRKTVPAIALMAALGNLAGCSSSTESSPHASTTLKTGIKPIPEYFSNGSRIIHFEGFSEDRQYNQKTFLADIYQFCDGNDLIEESMGSQNYPAGGLDRTIDFPACNDRRLTPEDFSTVK